MGPWPNGTVPWACMDKANFMPAWGSAFRRDLATLLNMDQETGGGDEEKAPRRLPRPEFLKVPGHSLERPGTLHRDYFLTANTQTTPP
jgi:hypothetical protein